MSRDPSIDPAVRRHIEDALVRIEVEHAVRAVLAVESGSRAWGFPSADSDYDVRFIYVRPLADYLSVVQRRDVIEEPIRGNLDVNGWDLRKALHLAVRSNAVLIEWLASPVRYRDETEVTAPLHDVAHAGARLPALEYHYGRLARRAFADISAATDAASLKRYFYALRPAFALAWLRRHRTPPPMDLPSLMAGLEVPDVLARTVEGLVVRKAAAREGDTSNRLPVVDAYLEEMLSDTVQRPVEKPNTSAVVDAADRLLVSVLRIGELPPAS